MQSNLNKLTVYKLLKRATDTDGEKEALNDLLSRKTYFELIEDVDHLANLLYQAGVRKDDRIAVSLPNWYETVKLFFATAKLGAILVPFNPLYTEEEVSHILKDSRPKLLFITEELGQSSLDALAKYVAKIIIVRGSVDGYENFASFIEANAPLIEEAVIDVADDVYCILYTSGTTGSPKGVMITHQSVVQSGVTISKELNCVKNDVYIIAAPLFHVFGMACNLFSAVTTSSRMILIEKYSPSLMLEVIEREKVTIQQGVPTMFLKELELENFSEYDVTSLRAGIVGAAPITSKQMIEIRNKLGMNLCQSYGITETGSVTMTPYNDREEKITSTLGKPISGVKIRIVDENRRELPNNEVGEIAIHSFGTMKGYYNMPEETEKVIDKDGWFYTEDLGQIDEEGYLHFVGREKELIIRGGYNIYPQEIEEFLLQHPSILDVAVVGLPDEILGEKICAVIQLRDEELTKENVIEYLDKRISRYKIPQEVLFVEEFPMTSSGKIKKNELKQGIMTMI